MHWVSNLEQAEGITHSPLGASHKRIYRDENGDREVGEVGIIHPGLMELGTWDMDEYAAGFRARFSDIPDSEMAHPCWRYGWDSADTEALESARHRRAVAEGSEDHFDRSWGSLFDSGGEARKNGITFDPDRTEPWKAGWITLDIALALLADEECA